MRLVVSRSHEKQYSVIFTELSRLFSYGRVDTDLVNFMVRVAFEASDAAGVDTVKIQAELSEMDSDVVPWEIKKTQILVTEQPEGASAEAAACQPEKDGADKKAKRKAKGNEAEEPLQVWPPPRPRSEMKLLQQQICSGPVGILPELPVPRGSSSANQAGSLPMVEPSSAFCQQQQSTVGGSPVALPSHVAPPRHSPEALPQTKSHNPQATQASGGSETPNPDTPCPATTDGPQQGNHAGSATPRNLHPDEPRDAGTPDRSDIRSMGFHTGGAGGFISEACKLALRDSLGALQLVPLELSALEMLGGNSETVLPSSLLDEDKQQVGRLGEQLIYQYLLKKYARTDAKVVWVNKEAETGKPYDLVITKSVEKSNTVVEYVEVKTSFSMDKLPFEMSIQELMFAEKHGPAYAIYRLIGVAAGAQPKLLEIWDPALGILAGQLNLVVVPLQ